MARQQLDLFGEEPEPDLFGPGYEPPVWRADPDGVRAKLHKILAEARAAERLPWDADRAGYYRTIFPQMTLSLPQEEPAQFEFETEMARLEAA